MKKNTEQEVIDKYDFVNHENARITLSEYLETREKHRNFFRSLRRGMVVHGALVEDMEIYGFLNYSSEIIYERKYNEFDLLGIVDKDPSKQIICGNYMYQVVEWFDGKKVQYSGRITPIYDILGKSTVDRSIDVANLYIPSLISHELYKRIRSRKGTGVTVTDYDVRRYVKKDDAWSSLGIYLENGKACLPVHEGDLLLWRNLDWPTEGGAIKSVGEEILVVCRYLHKSTGRMCYTQLGLDEITINAEPE